MTQEVSRRGTTLTTTRSPLRIDGEALTSGKAAPTLGEDDERVRAEFPPAAASLSPRAERAAT